jgi:hypothetical protein
MNTGMRGIGVACTAVALTAGLLTTPAPGGTGSGTVSGVSVTYTLPDAVRFDGPGCAKIPWTVSYQRPQWWDFYVRFDLRQAGSNSPYTDYSSPTYSDQDTGTLDGEMCVYDSWNPAAGPFTLTATLEAENDDFETVGQVGLPASRLTVVRNPSRLRLSVKAGTTYTKPATIRGKATAKTLTRGRLGAAGSVLIEARLRGKWRTVTRTYPDDFGAFAHTSYRKLPQGTKIRARLTDCGWCSNAKTTTTAR